MATRTLVRPRTIAYAGALTTAILYPARILHAEEPAQDLHSRKAIYDDLAGIRHPPQKTPSESAPNSQTPTNQLATQVRRARLFVHGYVANAEDGFNKAMSLLLKREQSFTSTIASLAPPKESHEQLMPGAVYVLVATMAGSIISRNRNILIRASFPAAVGITTAWYLLPLTMRNVSDLAWQYEERAPFIAENHLRARSLVLAGYKTGKEKSEGLTDWANDNLRDGIRGVESWVKSNR